MIHYYFRDKDGLLFAVIAREDWFKEQAWLDYVADLFDRKLRHKTASVR